MSVPNVSVGMPSRKNHKLLSDVAKSNNTTTNVEVVHAGIALNTHINVANAKIAITRCSTKVRPSMPKDVVGIAQRTIIVIDAMRIFVRREAKIQLTLIFGVSCVEVTPSNVHQEIV